jgi:hypothetical protein
MWKKREDIKASGKRFFEVDERIIKSITDRGYGVNDKIIEIHYKEESQLKQDLKSATLEAMAIEAKEYFTEIALASKETENPQNSVEWEEDRLGVINGSLSIFKGNGKAIDDLDSYASKKVTETVFLNANEELRFELSYSDGILTKKRSTTLMDRGHELEPESIEKWLENNPNYIEIESNMIKSDKGMIGVSLDLLALDIANNTFKIVEIKNPKFSSYIKHYKTRYLDVRYKAQIQLQMLISGIHEAELVIDYPNYKQIITKHELDIEFVVNAMQTHKQYMNLYREYLEIEKELRL